MHSLSEKYSIWKTPSAAVSFKLHSQPQQNVHLSIIFISLQKDLTLSISIGPVMGFPSEHTVVNCLHNALSSYPTAGSFNVCY